MSKVLKKANLLHLKNVMLDSQKSFFFSVNWCEKSHYKSMGIVENRNGSPAIMSSYYFSSNTLSRVRIILKMFFNLNYGRHISNA